MKIAKRKGSVKFTVGFKGLALSSDESVTDMAYAKETQNFSFDKGVLTGKIGLDEAAGFYPAPYSGRHEYPALPANRVATDIFWYKRKNDSGAHDDRIVARFDDGKFAYTAVFKSDSWHDVPNLTIIGKASAVNYNYNGKDILLIASDESALYFIDGDESYVCSKAPKFSSLAVHGERIFGTVNGNNTGVWFSDDFNPVNWTVGTDAAGFINFSDECGNALKVVSFLNYLYVFREFGIYRITAYGDQSEFSLKKLFTDTGRIYKDSIELCGDKITFYAEDGLYVFDGYDIRRVADGISDLIKPTDTICGAYLDGCYYLACRTFCNEAKNDSIIRYRLKDDSVSVLTGVEAISLKSVRVHNGSQLLCLSEAENSEKLGEISKSGSIFGAPTQKRYLSPENTMGSPDIKAVRSVSVRTNTPIKLIVKLDGNSYVYDVDGGENPKKIAVEHFGKTIGFEIACDVAEARISPLIVEADVVRA